MQENEYSPQDVGWKAPDKEGIPTALLEPYFKAEVEKRWGDGVYEYELRKNLGFGTDEEIRQAGIWGYQPEMKAGRFMAAAEIAFKVFGEGSKELALANYYREMFVGGKIIEHTTHEDYDPETGILAVISPDATIAVLEDNDALDDDVFYYELWKNFGKEVQDALIDLSTEERETTKVLDFFGRFGFDQADIELYLPIKFE